MATQIFTSTRSPEPDPTTLLAQLQALDATATVQHTALSTLWTIGKSTAWTAGQINAAQNALDTCSAPTPELTAQANIDQWPVELKALALALIDQLNVIRAALPVPLGAITPAQALAAIRNKAATL